MEEEKKPVSSDRPDPPAERSSADHAGERKPATWPPRPAGSNEHRSGSWPPPTRPASQPLRDGHPAAEKPEEETRAFDSLGLKPEEKTRVAPTMPTVGATPPPERSSAPSFGATGASPSPAIQERPPIIDRPVTPERPITPQVTPARPTVTDGSAVEDPPTAPSRPFDRTFTPPPRPEVKPEPVKHDVARTDWAPQREAAQKEAIPSVARPVQTPVVPAAPVSIPARVPQKDVTPSRAPEEKRGVSVRRLRRGRLAIRKIDPWAVLKFSLVFYFCMLLIFLLGMAIIFATLKAFGVIDNLEKFFRSLEFVVHLTGGFLFKWFFLIGLAGTLLASLVTMFMAFLYNLIADVVGGIELIVTERE